MAERDARIIGACSGFPQPCFRGKRLQLLPQGTGARCSHLSAGLVYCYNQYQLALNSICCPQALGVLTVLVWVYNVIKLI